MKYWFIGLYLLVVHGCCASSQDVVKGIENSLKHSQVVRSYDDISNRLQKYLVVVYCASDIPTDDSYARVHLNRQDTLPAFIPLPCTIYRLVKDADPGLARLVVGSAISHALDKHKNNQSVNSLEVSSGFTLYQKYLDAQTWQSSLIDPHSADFYADCM